MKVKVSNKKSRAVKNQFILSVGDEGAVFAHFVEGRLANKLFIDSPASPDVKLIERLTAAYPKTPIYMLVDVIEQNYTQQVLPPVSSINVKQQINRRLKRDFQPNDLTNYLSMGRSKEGRKDWNFLFISLANNDPFARWLEIVLNQKNDFGGVYLLPVEATRLIADLKKISLSDAKSDWELLVLHNRTGGFRIVAFKNGQIIFTRLAQNLVGENIAEITVGNMEQEISNTVEYLKRLAFRGEADSKITIVASSEILQKVTPKSLKFGTVELYTPHQLSEKLGLPDAVTDKDKFSDILTATHFAVTKKHVLKFNSPFTKKIEAMYAAIRGAYCVAALIGLGLVGYAGYQAFQFTEMSNELSAQKVSLSQAQSRLKDVEAKKASLRSDAKKLVQIMNIYMKLPQDKYADIRMFTDLAPVFKKFNVRLEKIDYKNDSSDGVNYTFTMTTGVNFSVDAKDQDKFNQISADFLTELGAVIPNYKLSYVTAPVIATQSEPEEISNLNNQKSNVHSVPAQIKFERGAAQ